MKVFFSGELNISAGPANVNKLLKRELDKLSEEELDGKKIYYIKNKNIILKQLEVIWKTLISDVIIYSGTLHVNILSIKLARFLRKKNLYIMHGCVKYESQFNGEPNPNGLKIEETQMKKADLICGVSEVFMNWIKDNYPQYRSKVDCLTNGIDWDIFNDYQKLTHCEKKSQIVLMGGDRKTKMNLQVCLAVQQINQETENQLSVLVFGKDDPHNAENRAMRKIPCVKLMGNQPHDVVLKELCQSILYVQNSIFEPFGLAVIEALMCGSNIVISSNVGAKTIFDIDDRFVIDDCTSLKDVKNAILSGIEYNNNEDILSTIDKDKTSGAASAKKLLSLIDGLYNMEGING